MIFRDATGTNCWTRGLFPRGIALTAAILLVSAQVIVAGHAASHLHHHDDARDCVLCVLSSQIVAQPTASPEIQAGAPVHFLFVDPPAAAAEIAAVPKVARAPPAISA